MLWRIGRLAGMLEIAAKHDRDALVNVSLTAYLSRVLREAESYADTL